jgi:hypothetical protein
VDTPSGPPAWVPGPPDRDGYYWVTLGHVSGGKDHRYTELVEFSLRGEDGVSVYYCHGEGGSELASNILAHVPVAAERISPEEP